MSGAVSFINPPRARLPQAMNLGVKLGIDAKVLAGIINT
jgi:hypothetical protein